MWKPFVGWRSWPKHYGEVWLNGQKVAVLIPANADADSGDSVLNALYMGGWQQRGGADRCSSSHTGLGEVAVYDCSISDDDVAYLYTHAPGPLPRGREMTVGLHFDRAYEDTTGGSPAMVANSGSLHVPFTMKGSTMDLTCEDLYRPDRAEREQRRAVPGWQLQWRSGRNGHLQLCDDGR